MAWLRLFADAGCLTDEQAQQAATAASAYTMALQQDLTDAGYYAGAIDGIYGPQTVQAVQALQESSGLPITGTVDSATAAALQAELLALGGAAAQESLAMTAAIQQTLKLVGFWDGPVDGVWTPELTEAVKAFQVELGVEPTGNVDAATIAAFQQALTDLQQPAPAPSAAAHGLRDAVARSNLLLRGCRSGEAARGGRPTYPAPPHKPLGRRGERIAWQELPEERFP